MKYLVDINEVWIRTISVDADNKEQAKHFAHNRVFQTGEDEGFEYSHELDKELWTVEEVVG